jgi:Restriction endonuclease
MQPRLPFEIREAVVAVCGKCFWLKDPFRAFLLACGVPSELYDRYADESKYKIARHVLGELDRLEDEGYGIQRRIVTELCKLRKVPDENVPDMDAALKALRWLKERALDHKLIALKSKADQDARAEETRRRQGALVARAEKMEELRKNFAAMVTAAEDPQSRGYGLEDLLAELFAVHEITYRPPYRTPTEQIDGHFSFKGFDYLVEARWRKSPPSEADLSVLKTKVDKKITSTRGLFVSIARFRSEVVLEFTRGVSANIVLVDGEDLTLILEGRISLTDALDLKIQKAAQEGIILFPLSGVSSI